MLTFNDLEQKFGSPGAYHWLIEIEKAARIASDDMAGLDPETRLANACRAQDNLSDCAEAA